MPQTFARLFVHMTEGQHEGTVFADSKYGKLLAWSGRTLMRNGTCNVSLAVDDPGHLVVDALATDGARRERIPSQVIDGRLMFTASVSGAETVRICYEIVTTVCP